MKVKYVGDKDIKLLLGDRRIKLSPEDELKISKSDYKKITNKDLFKKKKKKKKSKKKEDK